MNQFLQYLPIIITILLIITVALVRNRNELKQWWKTLLEEAECTSTTGILFEELDDEELAVLHEHIQTKNLRILENSSSPSLAAMARDLGDYVDPHARLRSVERAFAHRKQRQHELQEIHS